MWRSLECHAWPVTSRSILIAREHSVRSPEPIVPGRGCDGCTLCCKLMGVIELDKPMGVWCEHCDVGTGCRIYETRPRSCEVFNCAFLTLDILTEAWRPSKCKIVVAAELEGKMLAAHVDPSRPYAWKAEPYYGQLKRWARLAVPKRHQVVVCIGRRVIVILPDRDVDLGVVGDDEVVVTRERNTPIGLELAPMKIKRDDPRVAKLAPFAGASVPASASSKPPTDTK
jgi:hypothetical protein